jgi:hypothetical protein
VNIYAHITLEIRGANAIMGHSKQVFSPRHRPGAFKEWGHRGVVCCAGKTPR